MSPRATGWGAYREITGALRVRISGGEFAPGAALPSEAVLCTEYGVARNTLRRALEQLAEEGLIAVRPGRGRVVVSPEVDPSQATARFREIAADLRAMIDSGQLRPGDGVPSEAALAQRYGVARGTARHALVELEGAGLIEAVHGKGRYVRGR